MFHKLKLYLRDKKESRLLYKAIKSSIHHWAEKGVESYSTVLDTNSRAVEWVLSRLEKENYHIACSQKGFTIVTISRRRNI